MSHASFTCASTERRTPPEIVEAIRDIFEGVIVLDAASDDENPCSARWCWTIDDGEKAFSEPWVDRTFCNPPYGSGIERWVMKAAAEARSGDRISLLTSLRRLENRAFNRATLGSVDCMVIFNGRLKFEGTGDDVDAYVGGPLPGSHVLWLYNVSPGMAFAAFENLGTVLVPYRGGEL